MKRPRIAIDLDKTLVNYTEWQGTNKIDPLLPGAYDFVKQLSDNGWYIVLFTARADHLEAIQLLEKWMEETFPFLVERQNIVVTNVKLREIECIVDDRAIACHAAPQFQHFHGEGNSAYEYDNTLDDINDYLIARPEVRKALEERRYQ